jgi:hypothetical protein
MVLEILHKSLTNLTVPIMSPEGVELLVIALQKVPRKYSLQAIQGALNLFPASHQMSELIELFMNFLDAYVSSMFCIYEAYVDK